MLLGEELVLLLLDDEKGTWLVRRRAVPRGVRVAVLAELLARRTVAVDDSGTLVAGLSGTTGGDQILERAARDVVGKTVPEAILSPGGELKALLARLRDQGVLRRGTLRRSRHLARDHHHESAVRARLLQTLSSSDSRPDRHTALLVALVHELGLVELLFPGDQSRLLAQQAAAITLQLRQDRHYFPTGLEGGDRDGQDRSGRVLDGTGSVFDALQGVGDLLSLIFVPLRLLGRILDALP